MGQARQEEPEPGQIIQTRKRLFCFHVDSDTLYSICLWLLKQLRTGCKDSLNPERFKWAERTRGIHSKTVVSLFCHTPSGILASDWSVHLPSRPICAVTGASVVLPCSYEYPQSSSKVTQAVFKQKTWAAAVWFDEGSILVWYVVVYASSCSPVELSWRELKNINSIKSCLRCGVSKKAAASRQGI